jgi:hypothetical protein
LFPIIPFVRQPPVCGFVEFDGVAVPVIVGVKTARQTRRIQQH